MNTLGKPIGAVVGQAAPLEGEHGAGTGVGGGHVPSSSNQARGYGDDSGFNSGMGGEHASGGLPRTNATPIADKFMGAGSHSGQQGHSTSGDAVSGAYQGGSARDALTGESNAHTTGAGVGILGENLHGHQGQTAHQSSHSAHATHSAPVGAYDGSINRSTGGGEGHSHSARDAALTGTAGAAAATALGQSASHGHSSDVGVGAGGGSGGHYSVGGESGSHANANVGTGTSAGILAGQQAGARSTHDHSSSSSSKVLPSSTDSENTRGEPLSDPKDLDSGTRHGLVFDKATGKYVHRHELDEKK